MKKFKCTNRKCNWVGTEEEKDKTKNTDKNSIYFGFTDYSCPKCKNLSEIFTR